MVIEFSHCCLFSLTSRRDIIYAEGVKYNLKISLQTVSRFSEQDPGEMVKNMPAPQVLYSRDFLLNSI